MPVDSLACRTHRVGERTRTATEDTNFADLKYVHLVYKVSLMRNLFSVVHISSTTTHVAMLLLNKFEERRHVRPAEVVDGLQAREHAALR